MSKRTCIYCQCTDEKGCPGGCFWVLPNVCSACAALQLTAAGADQTWSQLPRQALAGLLAAACVAESLVENLMLEIEEEPHRFTAEIVTATTRASQIFTNALNLYDDTAAAGYAPERDALIRLVSDEEPGEASAFDEPARILITTEAEAAGMGIQIGRVR
jgi:hypothetical protein